MFKSMDWNAATLSNYKTIVCRHVALNVQLDFAAHVVRGSVALRMQALTAGSTIVLDTSALLIHRVRVGKRDAQFTLNSPVKSPLIGQALTIDANFSAREQVDVYVEYETTSDGTALQWLTAEQTLDKSAPFVFTQCQSIHARSLLPCQDTPAVKSTVNAAIRSPHLVLFSGLSTGVADASDSECTYTFEQHIRIPSYLIAIASGAIACAQMGPRSFVYAEPSQIVSCKTEFERDMESMIRTAEKIIFPYPWTLYNVLVAPPSFPFGGMENPNITFVTKSLIVGDRSEVGVVAHELAHSWSGNCATHEHWGDFWLNEGWTQFLERKIIGIIHKSRDQRLFHHDLGWRRLQEDLRALGPSNPYTRLATQIQPNETPEDSFTSVPYEKGSYFLLYLENLLGEDTFDKFIPFYFKKFNASKQRKETTDDGASAIINGDLRYDDESSVTSEKFVQALSEFFRDNDAAKEKLKTVDFNEWLLSPGAPPIATDFTNALSQQVTALAQRWRSESFKFDSFGPHDIQGWTSNQVQLFLEELADVDPEIGLKRTEAILQTYGFADSHNDNILRAIYLLALNNKFLPLYSAISEWLGTTGRSSYIRSIYRAFFEADQKLAIETFKKHEHFYHPSSAGTIRKLLKLTK